MSETKAHKGARVWKRLRDNIVNGTYKPGARLPTFDEMGARFGVSRAVLQAAVARLQDGGFVRTVDRRGTFVTDFPPYLYRYAMAFPDHPGTYGWSRFCETIVREFEREIAKIPHADTRVFWNIAETAPDEESLRRLYHEANEGTLAGIFLMPGTHRLAHDAAIRTSSVPTVYIAASFDAGCAPNIRTNRDHFYARACERFVRNGRRRVAVLDMADLVYKLELAGFYAAAGLEFRPQWHQLVGRSNPESARGIVHLLTDYPANKWPDALLVADDNLTEFALAGLADAGLVPGRDIEVIAHCNRHPRMPHIPGVSLLGYNISDMIREAVVCAGKMRRKEKVAAENLIPALFDGEE